MSNSTQPSTDELAQYKLRSFKGIEAGLGEADPVATVSKKLEAQYSGHLILVQSGNFLHGYDRTAYALAVLKKYKLKLGHFYDAVSFRNGYAKDAPKMLVECRGVFTGHGVLAWGAPKDEAFIIQLGAIIEGPKP